MIFDVLSYLKLRAQICDDQRLALAEAQMCSDLGAAEVKLQDDQDKSIPGHTLLGNAVSKTHSVVIRFERASGQLQKAEVRSGANTPSVESDLSPACVARAGSWEPLEEDVSSYDVARFIREFDRRERSSGAMWAKHVVNEFLPELGLPPVEGKRFLSRLESEGVIATTKVQSRNNPDFLATRFHLNRDHPQVKAVLQPGQADAVGSARRRIKLPPGSEPVSETLIRERR